MSDRDTEVDSIMDAAEARAETLTERVIRAHAEEMKALREEFAPLLRAIRDEFVREAGRSRAMAATMIGELASVRASIRAAAFTAANTDARRAGELPKTVPAALEVLRRIEGESLRLDTEEMLKGSDPR